MIIHIMIEIMDFVKLNERIQLMYIVLRANNYKGKSTTSNIWIESLDEKLGRTQVILFSGEHETQCWVRALGKGKVDCKGNIRQTKFKEI